MTTFIARRTVLHGITALGGAMALSPLARAQTNAWPNKPIRLIVPFNPGGATDAIARTFAQALSGRIGQAVLVENKPGASGVLGTAEVVKAPADGYTLMLSLSTAMLVNQFLYTKLPYKPQQDLTLLSQVSTGPVVLVVPSSVAANNVPELLAYVKRNKGKLSYGSWGAGSSGHLALAYMSKSQDADMTHIAYRGEAPMMQDLLGGRLSVCFASALNAKPFIESGQLKGLGVTGRQRMAILPELPTIYEQGVEDDAYATVGWVAIGAPAGLPRDVVDQLSAHIAEIAKDPKMIQIVTNVGFNLMMNRPEEFRQNYERDFPVWKRLVEIAEAKLD